MTTAARTRLLATTAALLLAAGGVATLAAPASAVRTSFTNSGGVVMADPSYEENLTSITISDNSQASVYSSNIDVVGSALIADVNVYLYDMSHTRPDDVDVLLVGPGGAQATIMSDAGGSNALANELLFIDDEAPTQLPDEGAAVTGSWRPANHEGTDSFPAPAPADTGASGLSVFDGTDVAGTWRLFVVDDDPGATGAISGGWAIEFTLRSVPSPSQIAVSGLGSRASDVNLTLGGLSHTFPDDIDVLLVGPGGQQATVMSDVGGPWSVAALDLTLDDEALAVIPDEAQIATGTYLPTNQEGADPFPSPAPAASGASALSAFDGTNPNGVWSLYLIDDFSADVGTLSSWSLDIETDNTPPTGSVKVNADAATAGSGSVTLNLTASDAGTPTSGVAEMRLSNDGVTFSAYQPYADTASWTLSSGDGTKTVYAQFRDGSGIQSAVVSDTITLDTTGPKAKKVKPQHKAKGVKATTKVKVVASEKLTIGSVTKRTVYLKEKGVSGKVKAKVSYNAATNTIKLTPKRDLHGGTKYTVTVKGVKDLLGHTWDEKPTKSGAQPLRFSFTTA